MPAAKGVPAKRVTLNLCTESDARAITEEALIDQGVIMTDPAAYQELLARLDQDPSPNAALCRTMQMSAPWEQKKDLCQQK